VLSNPEGVVLVTFAGLTAVFEVRATVIILYLMNDHQPLESYLFSILSENQTWEPMSMSNLIGVHAST
jgi:hypothetical protein